MEKRVETASGGIPWYVMLRPRRQKLFDNEKILVRQTASRILACYDEEQWYCLKSGILIQLPKDSKLTYNYLLSLLNSKLMDFLYQDLVGEGARIFPEVKPVQLFKLPIKEPDMNNKSELILFEQLNRDVKIIQEKYKVFTRSINEFIKFLKTKFSTSNFSSKMNDWNLLNSSEFLVELKKSKIKLSISEEAEWMQYFNAQKEKAQNLKLKIEKTDKEIDQLVYELYGLTEKEIKIVEEATA